MPELVKGWDAPLARASADAGGALLRADGQPATFAAALQACMRLGDWSEGDVAVTNDVFHGASHPTEFTAVTPVFHAGRIDGWKLARTDVPDVGGWELGSYSPRALDIWSEGGRIVPAKALRRGQPRREVLELLELNSRTPRLNRALVSALARTVLEQPFTPADAARASVGERSGEAILRAPGLEAMTLKVRVRKAGAGAVVSFPDLPAPSAAPLNATRAITLDALAAALGLPPALIDLDVPEESLLTATKRRPVGWARALTGEALFKALEGKGAYPDRDPHFDRQTGRLKAARARFIEDLERGL